MLDLQLSVLHYLEVVCLEDPLVIERFFCEPSTNHETIFDAFHDLVAHLVAFFLDLIIPARLLPQLFVEL